MPYIRIDFTIKGNRLCEGYIDNWSENRSFFELIPNDGKTKGILFILKCEAHWLSLGQENFVQTNYYFKL